MHFVTSNYNNLISNISWNKIRQKSKIDNNFNNFFLILNNNKVVNEHEAFHITLFLDNLNLKDVFKKIKLLKEIIIKNTEKNFFFYLFLKNNTNLLDSNKFNYYFLTEIQKLKLEKINNIFLKISYIEEDQFNYRNLFYLKFPFEISYLKKIILDISKNIKISESKPYKLIILDCDNTLWSGILDEDKENGIIYGGDNTGEIFYQFQKKLLKLKNDGFILSIASKNDEKNVWKAMKIRKMILQKNDFIEAKINWKEKSHNIKETLSNMALRAEDTLFIDDNLLEIKKVQKFLPKINTIHIDDSSEILNLLNKDYRLQKIKILKEDTKKYSQYKIRSKFDELKIKSEDNYFFYRDLKQKVKKKYIDSSNFERAIQIFNKTNQFNFSLNRYDSKTLSQKLKKREYDIKLFEFNDKFGSHGIIGAYICKLSRTKVIIEDFALSCRILGRYVEDYILYELLENYPKKEIYINYLKTNQNDNLIKEFLKKKFFTIKNRKKNFFKYKIIRNKELINVRKIFR